MTSVDPRLMANAIRFLSMDAIERAGEGHPGTPLGAADITTALFTRHLKFNARDPLWFDRDRFVQSNGHGSMLLYSLLYLTGYGKIGLTRSSVSASSGPTAPATRNTTRPRASRSRPACSARASPTPPHGPGRSHPEPVVRPGHRGPSYLRAGRRRLPPRGRRPGGRLAGRAPAARQADFPVGRQPDHRRRRYRSRPFRRHGRTLPRQQLACPGGRRA